MCSPPQTFSHSFRRGGPEHETCRNIEKNCRDFQIGHILGVLSLFSDLSFEFKTKHLRKHRSERLYILPVLCMVFVRTLGYKVGLQRCLLCHEGDCSRSALIAAHLICCHRPCCLILTSTISSPLCFLCSLDKKALLFLVRSLGAYLN